MKTNILQKILTASISGGLLFSLFLLQGCNEDKKKWELSVEVINSTSNQPFSPITVLTHDDEYTPYALGSSASAALETLAESGDNNAFLDDKDVSDSASGTGILAPGSSETVMVKSKHKARNLSLLTMLVNTNDGFAGLNSIDLSGLEKDESLTFHARVYDAGTEGNSETAADIPGQGGEGFNAGRDDSDFVAVHAGVVSQDDGLTTSALDGSHRFDNPGAKIIITRIK